MISSCADTLLSCISLSGMFFFFFNDTATTEIYTSFPTRRSSDLIEEHTSELQSRSDLVCRLLLEKKNHGSGHPLHFPSLEHNNQGHSFHLATDHLDYLRQSTNGLSTVVRPHGHGPVYL